MMLTVRPQPGDLFTIPGRTDLLTVARLIAAFVADESRESVYVVDSLAGARWLLVENTGADGPKWIGRALPADTAQP